MWASYHGIVLAPSACSGASGLRPPPIFLFGAPDGRPTMAKVQRMTSVGTGMLGALDENAECFKKSPPKCRKES